MGIIERDYRVSYREDRTWRWFGNEKVIRAISPVHACHLYCYKTGSFIRGIEFGVSRVPLSYARFKVCIGSETMYYGQYSEAE